MKTRWTKMLVLVALLTATGVVTVLAQEAAAAAPTPAAAKKMTLWDLIKTGGWAMWPLGVCSIGVVGFAVLNFRQVSRSKMMPEAVLVRLRAAAKDHDLGTMLQVARGTQCLFTNALAAGLRKLNPDDPVGSKPAVEAAIAEAAVREESAAGFWINFLSLIMAISPMLGLLGTVSGMIGAFQKIAGGGMGKPELLAGNIGEALITTAAGLIIAIPAMFFYFLFRNMLNRILQQAEDQYSLLLDDLTGTGVTIEVEEELTPAVQEGETPAP
ncbi:MAG TPA: MotA/TolQ/ExbB proton channel family protein [Kiritimatiellia bacterium]|nr:MotA/TolQ/ExbB proton channel family protein [Kiritimatiellia bacterium]